MEISDADLARRKKGWTPPKPPQDRGYWTLCIDHVLGADTGVDLDFLVGKSGVPILRESH